MKLLNIGKCLNVKRLAQKTKVYGKVYLLNFACEPEIRMNCPYKKNGKGWKLRNVSLNWVVYYKCVYFVSI